MQVSTNLRDVNRVAIVSCVRKVLREGVSDLSRYASCWTQAERSQQAVITRRGARLPVSDGGETSEGSCSVDAVVRIAAECRVATSDPCRRAEYLLRRRSIDVDRPD